ncbi:response regulator receiver domain protein (CheY-like) [Sulfurimonas denitrificans DSM 1251]|uniref:Response regulator receiver domain protein (CheY-like) n=1 Tax=Sulfurimonas denitrificans (strain ATCC 33889 / DSM 1251) TaxID=326298 RepID=Q30RW6_SULDN|nr:response regulator [Sulfurimonas denitrificans]ABB44265.1 response regulator receiver domain protein (CheY-like) [Sulfurimonas denitrificans DSM 1251]MDD3443099.1 response regulator [Sulfurimonas denitrificans]
MDKEQVKKLRAICRDISVLYVEDDISISAQLEKLLRKIFNNVEVEKNGLSGVQSYTKNRQDIVITDISMPVMDGIEMCKRIKLINSEQNILVTSAHNDAEYLVKLIDIGVDKFITKPIDMGSFLSNISKIAISIYREKRETVLESRIKAQQNLQKELLNGIIFPLAYFDEGEIVYANSSFKKQFFTEIDAGDFSRFRLGYLFENKKYVSMSNSELVQEISNSDDKTYLVMDVNKKIVKKYSISVTKFQNAKGCLLSFVNLNALNEEINRFSEQVDYFPKRESFSQALLEPKKSTKENYEIFCVGLKNTKGFIDKYGGAKMHSIFNSLAKSLKKEFSAEVQSKELSIYLFETNRYIFLVEKNLDNSAIDKRLSDFGKKYNYAFGSGLPLELSFIKENIKNTQSIGDILENTEGMLYTLSTI